MKYILSSLIFSLVLLIAACSNATPPLQDDIVMSDENLAITMPEYVTNEDINGEFEEPITYEAQDEEAEELISLEAENENREPPMPQRAILVSETETYREFLYHASTTAISDGDGGYYFDSNSRVSFLITLPQSMSLCGSIIGCMEFEGWSGPDLPISEPPHKIGEFFPMIQLRQDDTIDTARSFFTCSEYAEYQRILVSGNFEGAYGNAIYYDVTKGVFSFDYTFRILIDEKHIVSLRLWNKVLDIDNDLPRFKEIAGSVRKYNEL